MALAGHPGQEGHPGLGGVGTECGGLWNPRSVSRVCLRLQPQQKEPPEGIPSTRTFLTAVTMPIVFLKPLFSPLGFLVVLWKLSCLLAAKICLFLYPRGRLWSRLSVNHNHCILDLEYILLISGFIRNCRVALT